MRSTALDGGFPEIRELLSWIGSPPRSPAQTHGLNESDAEIVRLPDGRYLAMTTDAIAEELHCGLYADGYTAGWVAAMASLSDLAAVGANPLGMMLSAEWARDWSNERRQQVALGFSEALKACGTFWLGGDSGHSAATVLTGVAVGTCERQPRSRIGAREGDLLCITGTSGDGPALGFRFLAKEDPAIFPETWYRPFARLTAGRALAPLSHAMMDTSDGILSTIDTLLRLNGLQADLHWKPEIISERATAYCQARQIPLWLTWAAEHGDLQLIALVAPDRLDEARAQAPDLTVIGRATTAPQTSLHVPGREAFPFDPGYARRTFARYSDDLLTAFRVLQEDSKDLLLP